MATNYIISYNTTRIKRFFIENSVIFLFQFLIILNLSFSQPALPLYPPLGLAFTLFYLLGNNAFWGLFLGGLCGYLIKDLTIASTLLYLSADILGGYFAAKLCQKVIVSDIRPFEKTAICFTFLKINALIVCPLTAFLRISAVIWDQALFESNMNSFGLQAKMLLYYYIDLWLSDLNGILALSGFLLSWVYIFYSREKISALPIITYILFIAGTFLFLNKMDIIMLLAFAMLASIFWALFFEYLIGTLLMFIVSTFYLIVFLNSKQLHIAYFSLELYSVILFCLLLYILAMLWLSHVKIRGIFSLNKIKRCRH